MGKIITLFVCFFYILSISFVYAKNTNTGAKLPPSGAKVSFQKLSKKPHLAQRSVSGRKITQAVDSHIIKQTIYDHLDAISKICDESTEQSFDKRIENLEVALQELRQTIHQFLREPYLMAEDAIYLRSIEYNTTRETLSFAQALTGDLVRRMELNLGETFLMAYFLYYGIEDEVNSDDDDAVLVNDDAVLVNDDAVLVNIEDVKHEWAQKLYKGLSCIKIESSE